MQRPDAPALRHQLDAIVATLPKEARDYFAMHRERFIITLLATLPPDPPTHGAVLDIGCWPGFLSLLFRSWDWQVDAVDLAPERLSHVAAAGVRISSQNLNDRPTLPYADAAFDCIFLTEVFEHLNPACFPELFASIRRALKPGGRLVLTTPNRLALNKNLFIPGRWEVPEVDAEGHGHWKEYRLSEVREVLQSAGLRILSSRTVSFYTHLGRADGVGYFPLRELLKHPNKPRNLAKILAWLPRQIPPLRDSLILVAQG